MPEAGLISAETNSVKDGRAHSGKWMVAGASVAVDRHRCYFALDVGSSGREQPSWLDQMAGFASSRMTRITFQSSAGGFEQPNWRAIDSGLH